MAADRSATDGLDAGDRVRHALPLAPPGTLTFARMAIAAVRNAPHPRVDDNRDGADSLGLMLQMLGAEASVA